MTQSLARILVTDDEPLLLAAESRLFRTAGYEVGTAADGEETLRRLVEFKPDILLMDVVLPDIEGTEVCRRIKADPKMAGTFVILVSGSRIGSEEQASALEDGADGYIARPIDNRELLARVRSFLRIRDAEQKLKEYSNRLEEIVEERTATLGQANQDLERMIGERLKEESVLQSRVRIGEFAESHGLDEVVQLVLDESEALTGSRIGFCHFMDADQKTLHLQMWSTNTIRNMCTAEGKGSHYPVDQAGVWVDCVHTHAPVIHNDYPGLPHRKGLPEGHAPVLRELVVPVMRNDLVVMIMGVGNKPVDYDAHDVEIISRLANLSWDIVQRKRAEAAKQETEKDYRKLFESLMDGFARVDMEGKFLDCNQVFAICWAIPPPKSQR